MADYTYEIIEMALGRAIVRHDADGTTVSIPTDPANVDYQQYLADDQAAS